MSPPAAPQVPDYSAFAVPLGQHCLSALLHRAGRLRRWLGQVESESLRERIEALAISEPIYIAGLARSGSTILLEIVASHPRIATHRYRDFWSIFTPCWSESFYRRVAAPAAPVERSHGDGLMVTPDSPESMEEMLWMAFFPRLHDPAASSVLDARTDHPRFASFYRDHIRKLLLARQRTRYASKGNYNVTRMEYLLELFPDARFVLPVRRPRDHIASLRKQHTLFVAAARAQPRSVAYLDQVGHFEFGLHRRPIHTGDDEAARQVVQLWRIGDEVRGWARYWANLHGWLAGRLRANARLRQAVLVVRYEDLCDNSPAMLGRLLEHCRLDDARILERFGGKLKPPDYYRAGFSEAEERAIIEETESVARLFGYKAAGAAVDADCEFALPLGV